MEWRPVPTLRQALSHRERPHPPVEGGGPRPGDGALLRPAQLPSTLEPLAAYDLIGINSKQYRRKRLVGVKHHVVFGTLGTIAQVLA